MADPSPNEGSSRGSNSGESSDATVELNIKTLESQIYSFRVNKNMPVSAFKEKIANQIGVPVGQQRLIFRGRVLKDEHLLSEYQVENGHTLHLVARQPSQPQSSSDASGNSTNHGIDAGAPRIGHISHSVVLGAFNVGGDQGDGTASNINQTIGALLNSFGLGGQIATSGLSGMQFPPSTNVAGQTPQGNVPSGSVGNDGQSQAGNQSAPGQAFPGQPFQARFQHAQVPITAAFPIPSFQSPIPDSLNTLSEFMSRMERVLAHNGYQPNSSSRSARDQPRVELPSNARGFPTPEALGIVLRHAERLLSDHTIPALSHIAGRLEQEGPSSDPTIRSQIQAESVQFGLAMQHLGAVLLELGRTILTLRMGQTPEESSVNAGPAVYISPSCPNPIMVQPFPLQTNSLFGGPVPASNPMNLGHIGIGNASRPVNIHIHAGTSLAPLVSTARATSGEGMQGGLNNATASADSGSVGVVPLRNIIAAAVPSRSTGVIDLNAPPSGQGVSNAQPPSNSVSVSSLLDQMNSQLRSVSVSRPGETQPASASVGAGAPDDLSSSVDRITSHVMSLTSNAQGESQPASGSVASGAHGGTASILDQINSHLISPSSNRQGVSQPASGSFGDGAPDDVMSSVVDGIISQLRSFSGFRQGESQPFQGSGGSNGHNDGNVRQADTVVKGAVGSNASQPGVMSESDGQKNKDDLVQLHNDGCSEDLSSSRVVSSCSTECSLGETSLKLEDTSEKAPISGEKLDAAEGPNDVPLGLGLGGLERKRRNRQPSKSPGKIGDCGTTNLPLDKKQNTTISGQQLLQSLASRNSGITRAGTSDNPSGQLPLPLGQPMESRPTGGLGSDGQFDIAGAMSQVLQTPALDNLLAGFSEQTGVGSRNVLRDMMQQLTQNPQIMNTVTQMAQHVDSQDVGSMLSSLGSAQGGGIDLSRMVQQMMPVVSQVLGGGSATPCFPTVDPQSQLQYSDRSGGAEKPNDHVQVCVLNKKNDVEMLRKAKAERRAFDFNVRKKQLSYAIDLQDVAQRIEQFDTPENVFNAVVENAVRLNANGSGPQDILRELSNNEALARDYIEMLQRDISRRLNGDSGQDRC